MPRKVAVFLLHDKHKNVVLQHKTKDAPRFADHWCFFGGGIEKGETPEQAVRREAQEELQIELENLQLFQHFKDANVDMFIFTSPLKHSIDELRKLQREGDTLDIFDYEKILQLKMPPWDKIILKGFFKN